MVKLIADKVVTLLVRENGQLFMNYQTNCSICLSGKMAKLSCSTTLCQIKWWSSLRCQIKCASCFVRQTGQDECQIKWSGYLSDKWSSCFTDNGQVVCQTQWSGCLWDKMIKSFGKKINGLAVSLVHKMVQFVCQAKWSSCLSDKIIKRIADKRVKLLLRENGQVLSRLFNLFVRQDGQPVCQTKWWSSLAEKVVNLYVK